MKLIIDIPDEVLKTRHYCQYFGAWSTKLTETIENGIPYEERPQGDLISREALLEQINENKEIFESERVYLEGLILNAPAVEDVNPDYQIKVNIPEEETQKLIEELQRCRPCILPESEFTDDDIQGLIKENFNIGYEMAKNKYARPQGVWTTEQGTLEIVCSVCKQGYFYHPKNHFYHNFCPNCGADMRGEKE